MIYAAERLCVEGLTSSYPNDPALATSMHPTPTNLPQRGSQGERQAGQERQGQRATITRSPTGNSSETPDGRHREHRRRRAKLIVLAEKCLHRLDPGDPASPDSEI